MVFISVCYHVTICNDLRSVKVFKNAYHLLTFIPEYPCLLSSSILRSTVKKTSKSKFLMQIKTFSPKESSVKNIGIKDTLQIKMLHDKT